jgi:DNA excision repair protein ERCC-3
LSRDRFSELIESADAEISRIHEEIERKKQVFHESLKQIALTDYDVSKVNDFLSEPYVIIPRDGEEWYVAIPRFIDLQVGWLERQTRSYNIFRVNRYVDWLADLPKAIREALELTSKPTVTVQGEYLLTPPRDQVSIFQRYRRFLRTREGRDKIRIRPKMHFQLVTSLVRDGILPFSPHPVEKSDLLERSTKIELRDYQLVALKRFLEFGNVGIFWMPSAGKTIIALYIMNMLKGRKLVVVPSITLMEQWQQRIADLTELDANEFRIITYSSAHKVMKDEFVLSVFDECHHLPANAFSKLALIKTKYRVGLSATPYREDGRHELIFALTGFPVGLDWKHLMELRVVKKPRVSLLLVRTLRDKISVLDEIVTQGKKMKTLIFCDSLTLGKRLAKRYDVPFIHGQTTKRLAKVTEMALVVISRVGDEGVSLNRLERVIEFDFLFGSRRQELQRLGRLFHSSFEGRHVIIMTKEEYSLYRKRLFSIYEKGIEVEIEER